MSSYIPGAGRKKPLNQLEGPTLPDIRKSPPEFKWSRKFWQVDVGRTLTETEHHSQFIEPAVLVQSRDYNKTITGQTSHKDVVNMAFRPPLRTRDDFLPLSRIPRDIVIPTINPGTDGETSGYLAKNNYPPEITAKLTDRVKTGDFRPTFFMPLEVPQDNSVLPDLESKIPAGALSAGFSMPFKFDAPTAEVYLETETLSPLLEPGTVMPTTFDGPSGLENLDLQNNRPSYSANAGYNPSLQAHNIETPVGDLYYNRPQVAAHAGFSPNTQAFNIETPVDELEYNRPQVSVSAGQTTHVQADNNHVTPTDVLTREKYTTVYDVLNPTPDFRADNSEVQPCRDYNPRPRFSYAIPAKYEYQIENHKTAKPFAREKAKSLSAYRSRQHQVFPRAGIEPQQVSLKQPTKESKAKYRFN